MVSRVPLTASRPAVATTDAVETVPLIVSAPNPFDASRILTVRAAPFIVTVLAVAVSVEPAPDVSQFPATVHVPEVVIVPEVPPVMVTFVTLTVDVPAVRVAPLFTVKFPPVPVFLGQAQGGNDDFVVKLFQRPCFEEIFADLIGFIQIQSQHPLIETCPGFQYRFIT